MRTVYPQPGHIEAEVTALLASGQFQFADCITVEPILGSNLYYTSSQSDVSLVPVYETVTRRTFLSGPVSVKGLRMKCSVGVSADEQDMTIDYPPGMLYQASISWPEAILQGRLDGAKIRRDRYIRADQNSPWLGGWKAFRGRVAGVDKVGRSSATVKVKSDLILLDAMSPRDLYEPNCKNTWGDPNCGVDKSAFAVVGVVGASPSSSVIPWASSGTTYALGMIEIASGDAVTRIRTIARADATHLYLAFPLDFIPNPGDSFTAYPGCDRTTARCLFFHGDPTWKTRFKGFPYIPVAESAVGVGVGSPQSQGGK